VTHLSDDELVLHYYGEDGPEIVTAERHLKACTRCARAYEALARTLNTVIPPELVEAFDDWYARWRDEGFEPIREAWLGRATGRGEVVRVRLEGTTLHGRFLDLDGDGALLLESPEARRRVAAGEVFPVA